MLFKSKKSQSKKEFIQYKDGKIVSVEVEKPRKPQAVVESEEIPLYQEMEPKKPKEKATIKVKNWMTAKKLKVIVGIIVLIFFAFTLLDIYKAFFVEDATSTPKTEIVSKTPGKTAEPKNSDSSTIPDNKEVDRKAPTANKQPDKEKETLPASESSLRVSLETANLVNQVIVGNSYSEIQYIEDYAQRKANKIGLGNHLEKTLKEKQAMYASYDSKKDSYEGSIQQALYKTTEDRLLASILFSKNAQLSLQQGRGKEALRQLSNEYVAKDEELRKKQVQALIQVLEKNKIPYEMNEATSNVEYVLK